LALRIADNSNKLRTSSTEPKAPSPQSTKARKISHFGRTLSRVLLIPNLSEAKESKRKATQKPFGISDSGHYFLDVRANSVSYGDVFDGLLALILAFGKSLVHIFMNHCEAISSNVSILHLQANLDSIFQSRATWLPSLSLSLSLFVSNPQ
jgi:hypothetical protein